MRELENSKQAMLFAVGSFMGVSLSFMFVDQIIQDVQEGIGDLVTTIIDGITNFFAGIIGVTTNEIIGLVQAVFSVVTIPIQGLVDVLTSFFEGLAGLPDLIFITDNLGVGGATPLAWGLLGMILIGIGVAVATSVSRIPIVDNLTDGIGSVSVVMGGMVGVWGFFPDRSEWIIGGVFIIIFGVTALTYMNIAREELQDNQ